MLEASRQVAAHVDYFEAAAEFISGTVDRSAGYVAWRKHREED